MQIENITNNKYSYILAVIKNGLNSTLNILEKAKSFATEKGVSDEEFLNYKLADDMLPFAAQIRIVSDNAKGHLSKLAGVDAPKMEDNEKTFAELFTRIKNTQDYVNTFTSESFVDADNVKITFGWMPGKYLESKDFTEKFALSNFYFHITTAYAVARMKGVDIGKMDFVGNIEWKDIA